jgi:hydrogenase maturation protein HypF
MAALPTSLISRKRIQVRGIVQGVGFRPFVYNLANRLGLAGFVLNHSGGVTIEIEGTIDAVDDFVHRLCSEAPPLASIENTSVADLEVLGDPSFSIRTSHEEAGEFSLISPDVATCADCWQEFGNPENRRYLYPFTNCTNCGPRYTIVEDIPYDRPKTTMSPFQMCESCRREYEDPADRRFHAQPNACPVCGPGLALVEGSEEPSFDAAASGQILRRVRALLKEGKIVAVKGLGGFLLACDASNDSAVGTLRQRKRRSDKPFAVMVRDLESVEQFCTVTLDEREALQSRRRPIVVLARRPDSAISRELVPGNNTLGVMLPYTPLHYLLFSDSERDPSEFTALVMTSGNISEEPIVIGNREARQQLANVADAILLHNRDIYMRTDDSVVRVFHGQERVLRRSRGYVPQTINLGVQMHEVLACGAELKNAFCLTKGSHAILSQHIGDFENYETHQFFEETLRNLKKLFRVEPEAVAFDLHPGYLSSRFAQRLPITCKLAVQHHHAHIASCMAENHLDGKVIGVAFDGTGFGTDGKIWGGEFLVADFERFSRRAHFRYVPLAGGDAAVRSPWRASLSYLRDAFGDDALTMEAFARKVPKEEVRLVHAMLSRRINTVETSSCGRLFDAVAALIGLRSEVNFEGQAAIELESIAATGILGHYPFALVDGDPMQIDFRPMIEEMVHDIGKRTQGEIAARFHNTIAQVVLKTCERIREQDGLNRVCLSGGTFQNLYILERVTNGLQDRGFGCFLHSTVPANDGGISLGQAVIMNQFLRNGASDVPGDSR